MSGPPDPSQKASFGYRRVPEAAKAPLVRAVFDSVAERYDLMNDLMSGGIHRWWKARWCAWLNPRPGQPSSTSPAAPATSPAGPATPRRGAGGDRGRLRHQSGRCSRSAATARSTPASSKGIEWLCGDAEALPFADRSFDLYTIAFGLRNVTRIERALAEAPARAKARRALPVPRIHPGGRAAAQPLYDLYSFQVLPLLGPDRHRRPRRLHLSRREHPPLSAAGELATAMSGRARADAQIATDRRHRRAAFRLAA